MKLPDLLFRLSVQEYRPLQASLSFQIHLEYPATVERMEVENRANPN